jgi:pimeloyl-ACP methyl ester carboxylesterase/ketosteroid isomerase-like protein
MSSRRHVATRSGDIAYLESGAGAPAVLIHGLFLNADLWQHQLAGLADVRRCVAPDLLGHGSSAVPADRKLTIGDQVDMIIAFLDELGLEDVDLVGNDSGGAIAQIIAARMPGRIRTLTLTNCDTHDNWPPEAFAPLRDLASQGQLASSLAALAADPALARGALAAGFEHPENIPEDTIRSFFGPFGASQARAEAIQNYVTGMDSAVTVAIRGDLARLQAPTLVVWGTDDEFFDVTWAQWLAETIPGTVRCVLIPGGRLFHPFERPQVLNAELRQLWADGDAHAALNQYLDAWNRHDLDEVMSWHTRDTISTLHIGGLSHYGRNAVRDAFRADLDTWPDVHWQPIRRVVTPQVWVVESTMTATATSPVDAFGRAVPAGAAIRVRCADVLTIDGGKIAHKDTYLDVFDLLSSTGSAP